MRNQHLAQRVTAKRRRAGAHLVQDDAKRVDIGALVHRRAVDLLGRHVLRSAHQIPSPRQLRLRAGQVHHFGHAEVHDLEQRRLAGTLDQEQVVRFQIAVHQPCRVRSRQARADLIHDGDDVCKRHLLALQRLRQRAASQLLHHVVQALVGQLADIKDIDQVLVANAADKLRFLQEAVDGLGVACHLSAQDFARGLMVQLDVLSGVDHTHATAPDDVDDLVVTDGDANERFSVGACVLCHL